MGVEKKLGKRVADLRREAGLSQAQLAEKVRVSTETISRLERGASMPSLAGIERVAAALRVELADLFRFRERETAKDRAVERLLGVVRPRTADDVEGLAEVAECVFRRWG